MTRRSLGAIAGATAALAAIASAAPAFAANLIVNGDFEARAISPAGFLLAGDGADIGGWRVVGPARNSVALFDTDRTEPNIRFEAQSGRTSLDITGGGNTGLTSGITQTVDTIAGQVYRLSFWVGNADGSGNGNYTRPSTVMLQINEGALRAFTNAEVTFHEVNWLLESFTFTASNAHTTISFFNGTPIGDAYAGLDNVRLAAVPEPASWALMISGFGLAGAALRRRRLRAIGA